MSGLQIAGRGWMQGCLGALALGLAGCTLLPQRGAGQPVFTPALAQGECQALAGEAARLQAVHAGLARQGMALRVRGCPQLPPAAAAGAARQVIAVDVLVVDGKRAADTVRGPLADGEALDMGSAALQAGSSGTRPVSTAQALSPDVLHNRAWLRSVMAGQGFRPVGDLWWAFLPR